MPKTPSYRKRSGYSQAIVTLSDAATGARRDFWLGEHGSPESREAYHRLIAEWEANGRLLPGARPGAAPAPRAAAHPGVAGRPAHPAHIDGAPTASPRRAAPANPPTPHTAPTTPTTAAPQRTPGSPMTVVELVREYWLFARGYYSGTCASGVRMALRVARELYGSTPAADFGPNALRVVREAMARGREDGDRPRRPWCRKTVNERVGHLVRMYRWAASRELLGPQCYQALQTLPPLKRGRCSARDNAPVGPAPQDRIDAVRPLVARQVRALIDLQLLTGARPGELLGLRARDIDTGGPGGVWVHRPAKHKNAHRRIERSIYLGPRAQQVLSPFMADRPLDAFLFSPAEAEIERRAAVHARRKTPLSCGNRPGSNESDDPAHQPGDRYTTASYRRAIERACDAAFPPPERLRARAVGRRRES